MIPYNYNIYGINTVDYTAGVSPIDSAPSGTLLKDHYTLDVFFNNTDPLYSANRSKQFDESLYLWHIGAESAAATNAAYCVEASNTLNIEVSMNKASNVSLACQLTNVTNNRFQRTAQGRMCYDYFYSGWCDYLYSRLFVDINRKAFCARPVCQVYDKSTNQASTQSIQNVAAYINQNPSERYVYAISFEMYNSVDIPRTRQQSYIPDRYANERGVLTFDILTDRPIPSNATALKNDMLYHYSDNTPHDNYITDKCYSPFTQVSSGLWYSGTTQTFNPYYIGFRTARTVTELINGFGTATHGGKVTGAFVRYSDKVQDFDDVKYKWKTNVYYNAGGVFLNNGFPLNSLTGTDTINVFSSIEILDKKGLSDGAAIQAAVKHECAFYGFYFADTLDDAQNVVLGTSSTHIYLPEFVGGVTTGRYFTGDDIPNVPYANSTSVSDSAFKYTPEILDNDSGDLTTHIKSGAVSGGLWYKLTSANIAALSTWLNTTYKPDEQTLSEDFKGVNPSDYIISLKYYPFDVTAGSSAALSIGSIDTGVTADLFSRIYGTGNSYYDLGGFTMQQPYCFGNFLDKYIKLQVYIPYCGIVDLDPVVYCPSPDGTVHTINIALQVDYATGQCVGLIYRDALLMDTVQGCCGVDIPFSAVQQGSYQNNVKQAELAIKQAKAGQLKSMLGAGGALIGTAAAAFTGNVPAVLLGAAATVNAAQGMKTADISRESADYNLEHTAPNISGIESASPFNAMIQEDAARIFIYKPVLLQGADLAAYAKTTGYACCKQGKLSSFTGLTVCSSSQLNFDAPASHKTQLQQMLAKGVYV